MIFSLYWIFFKFELQRLFFIYLGTLSRKFGIFTGSTIHHFAPIFLTFLLPLDNIATFWDFDVTKLKLNMLILLPLWLWKLTLAAAIGYFAVEVILDIPPYFRWTFIALLVSEPIFEHTSYVNQKICPLLDVDKETSGFKLDIDCKDKDIKDIEFLKLLNSMVQFFVIPVFLKIDKFVYSQLGKTMVWIDYEGYFKQFETEV